jgi:C4-dicarboxylate-specific signal transduction histidine kinase
MNIPEFNFYYLADARHNPGKNGVWVDEPYVDPAGRGWMVSAIAPVYVDGALEGVAGLDVNISALVDRYFSRSNDSVVIISRSGVIVAATESAIQDMEMPPLRNHKYLETVKLDTFRPDEYNLRKSTLRPVRELAGRLLDGRETRVTLDLNGDPHVAYAAPVTEVGWIVIDLVSTEHPR